MATTKAKAKAHAKVLDKAKPKPKKAASKPAGKGGSKKPAAKVSANPWTEPEYLAAYDSETIDDIKKRNEELYNLKTEWELTHSKAERLKKELKEKTEDREKYMRERDALRGKNPGTLFAEAERAETIAGHKERQSKEEKEQAKQKNIGEASGAAVLTGWFPDNIHQRFPLGRLKKYQRDGKPIVTDKDIMSLAGGKCKKGGDFGPIDTVGRLGEYMTPGANGWQRYLNDVVGVGPAGQQRIEDAMVCFWADWKAGLAEEYARELGYAPKAPEVKADANRKTKPGTVGGNRKAQGKGSKGKPARPGSKRKPSPSQVAERLINDNDLADAATSDGTAPAESVAEPADTPPAVEEKDIPAENTGTTGEF